MDGGHEGRGHPPSRKSSAAVAASPDGEEGEGRDLPPFIVVGIGASAGGLEACTRFLEALAPDTGMAFILVQHLSPKHTSALPELLASHSHIPVVQATDGVKLKPDHLYVIPPDAQMDVAGGALFLTARPPGRGHFNPIDHFFRSLAEYGQSRSIGIVLSGTASDGAFGLQEIKAASGITFAQDPKTAGYDGMPHSAIATGAVDLVLPPAAIAQELSRIAGHPLIRPTTVQAASEAEDAGTDDMTRIFSLLRNASGVDFTHYKQPTIKRRLHRRMVLHKLDGLPKYVKLLQQNPAEVLSLYQDLLIHVTRFFRERESFDVLATRVLPEVVANRRPDSAVRVWIPGCSTGEEAYSVAIMLAEFLGDRAGAVPVQVFATDVSEAAVERARTGSTPRASPPTSRRSGCGGTSRRWTGTTGSTRPCATCASSRGRTSPATRRSAGSTCSSAATC